MSRLAWNTAGTRLFESGVDRGVLYTTNSVGVAWNGLISVKEARDGGEARAFYLDGQKYLNISTKEEFGGTIEAFTYPDEFEAHDGSVSLPTGLIAQQQRRRPFGFSYRTKIGNDIVGAEHGYKLHIVYNALVEPSDRSYTTFGSNIEPSNFSWTFSTLAKKPKSQTSLAPMAHVIVDSTKSDPTMLRYLEDQLYGSDAQMARLVSLDEIFALFEKTQLVYSIIYRGDSGLNPLNIELEYVGDLYGNEKTGHYYRTLESRLTPWLLDGFYTLGYTSDPGRFVEDPADPGTYIVTNGAMTEDPHDSGTYLIDTSLIKEDVNDVGTYVLYSYTSPTLPSTAGLVADPNDEGTYFIVNGSMAESLSEPGVYVINSETVQSTPTDPGIYVY